MTNKTYKFLYVAAVFVLALFIAITGACKAHKPNNKQPGPTTQKTIKILTFGDSVTRGERDGVRASQTYTYYLGEIFKKHGFNVRMIREGNSGEDTRGALHRIQPDVIGKKPDIVTIMYGTNDAFIDAWDDENDTTPRVPLERYEENLRLMIRKLKEHNIKPVLMTPIPPGNFWGADAGIYKGKDRNFIMKEYAAAVRRVAAGENVLLVDHFGKWLERKEKGRDIEAWMTDGMHPNPRGHRFIAAEIFSVLKNRIRR